MKTILSWSSGKDSAWALGVLRADPSIELVGLLSTLNETHERVAMHAVRRELLERQAEAVGLPLDMVPLPHPCPNGIYERRMSEAVQRMKDRGVEAIAFGDLYLEDIRAYREKMLEGTGIRALFPLWRRDTRALGLEMIDSGLVAHLTAVDPRQVPAELVGRRFDHDLLQELPEGVDPCGENGEFHTFVSAGPMLEFSIPVTLGERVEREGFWYADLALARSGSG